MGQLCIYLPPFACDYSGVCSALFDLNCMTAINDASCCTGHYVYYDEPRWTQNIKPIFSTALRTIDAVLGNDNKIIDSICAAAESLNSQMISVVGTPVPAITGMDMDGVAAEIENRTGKLSFGFNTTGFSYYDHGVAKAGKALISRLATPCPPDKQRVNIVGMTPLDFGTHGNDTALQSLLNANGWQIGCNFFMGMTTAQIQKCAAAKVNLAVSAAGLAIAKYLQQRFGTPYITGFPMGSKHGRILMDAVDGRPTKMPQETPAAGQKLLIISDQILGNSLRAALRLSGYAHGINVASFFGWDKDLAETGDVSFRDESQYIKLLQTKTYATLVGDPLLMKLPAAQDLNHYELVHPAVSAKLGWDKAPNYLSPDFEALLEQIVQQ